MMRIVLDTNVLVSGLLNPFGTCGQIARMLTTDRITLCVDARILIEYDEVLHRPLLKIQPQQARALLDYIEHTAEKHESVPLPVSLPDENDRPFLEVAHASNAACLVTGNLKHYPRTCRRGVRVLSPKDFLALQGGNKS